MTIRARAFLLEALDSLWFLPTAIIAVGIGAAFGLIEVDRTVDVSDRVAFGGSPTSARAVLATVAASMLSIIGITVPLTVVALQLAAGQFTQRVLRNFLRDRLVQGFFGMFIGVFAYSLIVLRSVRSAEDGAQFFVPEVSVSVSVVLALLSLALFVAFVNHVVNLIQVTHIMQAVADETRQSMTRLFPGDVGAAVLPDAEAPEPPEGATAIRAPVSGYLQRVDARALYRLACERYETLWVVSEIGEFCPQGAVLLRAARGGTDAERDLQRYVQLGRYRTVRDDVRFGFRQIADIAVRALSPGINDPTTATQCADYLGSLLLALCNEELPGRVRQDDSGAVRLVVRRPDFEAYVSEAIAQIREFGEGNVAVTRRLIEVLVELVRETEREERRSLLRRELELVLAGARRSVREPEDLAALERLARVPKP